MKMTENAQTVANKIIDAFRSGNIPKAIAPSFLSTNRHCSSYSWSNQIIVALSGYTDADGFKGWLAKGRQVRKGEKSFLILARMGHTIEVVNIKTGEKSPQFRLTGFRAVAVFGIEQTDIVNQELWAKSNKGHENTLKYLSELPLREVADKWGIKVGAYNGEKSWAQGWYSPTSNSIALGVSNLSTWAHELIHAADDKLGTLTERGQHWRSEIVAELGGAVLLYACGYERESDLGGAWDYIQKYAAATNKEPISCCVEVVKRICNCVDLIIKTSQGDKVDQVNQETNCPESATPTEKAESEVEVLLPF